MDMITYPWTTDGFSDLSREKKAPGKLRTMLFHFCEVSDALAQSEQNDSQFKDGISQCISVIYKYCI